NTTSAPAASAATAASVGALREELPLQAQVLALDALRQLGLEALEALSERTVLEAQDLRRQDGRVLGAAAADRHRRHRHAGRHLHGGEEGVEPAERARSDRHADH